jgi:hypothetical protein
VVIRLDTRRFIGLKTRVHSLAIDNGKTTETWNFIVRGDSQDPPKP